MKTLFHQRMADQVKNQLLSRIIARNPRIELETVIGEMTQDERIQEVFSPASQSQIEGYLRNVLGTGSVIAHLENMELCPYNGDSQKTHLDFHRERLNAVMDYCQITPEWKEDMYDRIRLINPHF